MSTVGQGLTLSGIGILITFSALGILILIIAALKAIFPARTRADGEIGGDERLPRMDSRLKEDLRRETAAVGVAVLRARGNNRRKGSLGARLESPPGEWWRKGLDRVHGKEPQ